MNEISLAGLDSAAERSSSWSRLEDVGEDARLVKQWEVALAISEEGLLRPVVELNGGARHEPGCLAAEIQATCSREEAHRVHCSGTICG